MATRLSNRIKKYDYGLDLFDESKDDENQKWITINKIVVGSERDKKQILAALEYLHDGDINTDLLAVNCLVHLYRQPDMIEVSSILSQKEHCEVFLKDYVLPDPRSSFGTYGPYDRT